MSTRNIWPIAASGAAAVLKHSYVALAVDAASLAPLAAELQAILGEGYAELRGNRDARDSAGHYHLTALEPREFRTIVKQKRAAGSRLELPSGELPIEILGIGTAVSETSQAWFAVCHSEAVAAWRSTLELPAKDLHITLAFGAGGDVHGAPKGIGSLLTV